jgi:hypothetical protein
MKKYEYENATVYITIPNEKQIENIRKATEEFARKLVKRGIIQNGQKRQNNRRTSIANPNARRRNQKAKEKGSSN